MESTFGQERRGQPLEATPVLPGSAGSRKALPRGKQGRRKSEDHQVVAESLIPAYMGNVSEEHLERFGEILWGVKVRSIDSAKA